MAITEELLKNKDAYVETGRLREVKREAAEF